MKQFDLIYSPEDKDIYLFNNLDLNKLREPLTIEREEPIQEEEQVFEKKKSEIVEYEDEEYVNLKEEEQEPFIITDSESRTMCGKLQEFEESASMYFAFVNTGNSLKVVPISKWYGFVQKNQFTEVEDIEGLEKNLGNFVIETEESNTVEDEVDFEENFDDDDGEDNEITVNKEKMLSTSGRKMQGLVECYEENQELDVKEEEKEEEAEDKGKKVKVETVEKKLTHEDIKKVFKGKKTTVKDLLLNLRTQFKMDESEKILIRDFLKENCIFEIDPVTNEKIFKLKK
jgi:hypothetical protein